MPDVESGSLALGFVFPYKNPVAQKRLISWLVEQDFDRIQDEAMGVSIGPQGATLNSGTEGIAQRDGLSVLYNEDSDISGLASSSFITVKSPESIDFGEVLEMGEDLYNWLDDLGEADKIKFCELTLDCDVRIRDQHDPSAIFSTDALSLVGDLGGTPANGIAAMFESTEPQDSDNYYRFLLNQEAGGNPNIWKFHIVKRYPERTQIRDDDLMSSLDEVIQFTSTETDDV